MDASVEIDPDFGRRLDGLLADRLEAMGRASVRQARANMPVRTGASRASVTSEVDRATLTMRFGSPLLRVRFLELGTEHMAPRAPLRRALDELGPDYKRMLIRGR